MCGQDPKWRATSRAADDADDQRAHTAAQALSEIHDHLRAAMGRVQQRHAVKADWNRPPAPRFLPGDRVWLNARNVVTRRPSRKLAHRRLCPFEVVADPRLCMPYAARLRLPAAMQIRPVSHLSLLEHAADDPFPGQRQLPPPPVEVDGEEEYHVDDVLDSRLFNRWRKLQYLVKWTGYDCPTWKDAANVNGPQAVDRFHTLHPQKPGPLPLPVDAVPPPGLALHSLALASPELSGLEGDTVMAPTE